MKEGFDAGVLYCPVCVFLMTACVIYEGTDRKEIMYVTEGVFLASFPMDRGTRVLVNVSKD